ncbi:gamma-type small acid-soluble spore protein [Oceanobacillus bengalensis]|uniref:Gamma-type small acid-soluble spore protein n=1 Tax=Oceanobacillus bengalensis TaxID=1435466 RepID=A0A494YS26_9BACI|nr:gamma-type small acid-soluble spore protein [Oceanobacillus bengalensis]RKQ12461.1 gamma-type small acid-soluble spore protein [Oceanobacillus bengalensis]
MKPNRDNKSDEFTVAGTNIEEVKRKNENSGMSYNEVKEFIANTTGGIGTGIYSDTNVEEVKSKIHQEKQ